MDPINLLGILLGLGSLLLIGLAVLRGEFSEIERPKYEMLDQSPPPETRPAQPGCVGVEDRIIRFGLAVAASYYAARLGWGTAWGIGLVVLALYLGATALIARDYLYKFLKLNTRLPEHRR